MGNVVYTRDYSEAHGRSNESKTWMYYLNTDTPKATGVPWKSKPFTQGVVKESRHSLLGGQVVANYLMGMTR